MANECSFIRGATNSSIAHGLHSIPGYLFASHLQRCSKGKDYTFMYGKHVGTGSLTPYIAKAFDERVDR